MRNGDPLGKETQMVDNESWRISIEQSADFIEQQIGAKTVLGIFKKYNTTCLENLNPIHYSEVFNELSAIEADLKN